MHLPYFGRVHRCKNAKIETTFEISPLGTSLHPSDGIFTACAPMQCTVRHSGSNARQQSTAIWPFDPCFVLAPNKIITVSGSPVFGSLKQRNSVEQSGMLSHGDAKTRENIVWRNKFQLERHLPATTLRQIKSWFGVELKLIIWARFVTQASSGFVFFFWRKLQRIWGVWGPGTCHSLPDLWLTPKETGVTPNPIPEGGVLLPVSLRLSHAKRVHAWGATVQPAQSVDLSLASPQCCQLLGVKENQKLAVPLHFCSQVPLSNTKNNPPKLKSADSRPFVPVNADKSEWSHVSVRLFS